MGAGAQLRRAGPRPHRHRPRWRIAAATALDDATRRLLEAASLAGGSFDAADLAGSTALTDFEQVAALEQACATRLLAHDSAGALRFTHDLLAQALAERLSPERRRLLHRRLAEALEIRADALLRQGQATAAEAALDEAVQRLPAGPSAQRGKLLLGAGRARFYRGNMDGAVHCLDGAVRAYTAVGALEPLAKASYMRGAIEMHRARPALALRWLERGRALAERAGSVPVQRGAILNIVKLLTQTGRVPEALAALQAGETPSPLYENATIEAAFVQSHYYCQVLQGDIEGALERLPAVLATGDACVDVYWRVGARQLVVDLLLLTGRLDRAAELLGQARALCEDDSDGHHLPLVLAKQAWLSLLQGDAAGALRLLAPTDEGSCLAEAVDVRRHVGAAARLAQGDAPAALALLPDPGAASTEESKALQWAVQLQAEAAAGGVQPTSLAAVAKLLAGSGSLPALEADVLRRARVRAVDPAASPVLVLR